MKTMNYLCCVFAKHLFQKHFIYFLLFFLILNLTPVKAQQNDSLKRVEIEVSGGSGDYYVIPIGKNGIMVFYESDEKIKEGKEKKRIWFFTKYDTDFKEIWTKELHVPNHLDYTGFTNDEDFVYIFMKETEKKNSNYSVYQIDNELGGFIEVKGILPNCNLDQFTTLNGKVLFGGTTHPTKGEKFQKECFITAFLYIPILFGAQNYKCHPVVYYADFKNKTQTPLALNHEGSALVTDICADGVNNKLDAVIINAVKKDLFKLYIKEYNIDGTLNKTIDINSNPENILLTGKALTLKNKNRIIIGTYAKDNSYHKMVYRGGLNPINSLPSSNGMYFTEFGNDNQKYIKFYGFDKFQNFGASENMNTKKAQRKKKKGKDVTISYDLLIHDIIEKEDGYVMVAEAYYPQYHTETHTSYNAQGQPVTTTIVVFDGYRFTHAIAAGFNKNGDMQWNHTLKIMDILTFDLRPRVNVMTKNDVIVLAYNYNGYLQSKIIEGKDIVDGKRNIKIDTGNENDKVRASYSSDVRFWYDKYYIAYGYQFIKNKEDKEKKRRTVFYFNKIGLE